MTHAAQRCGPGLLADARTQDKELKEACSSSASGESSLGLGRKVPPGTSSRRKVRRRQGDLSRPRPAGPSPSRCASCCRDGQRRSATRAPRGGVEVRDNERRVLRQVEDALLPVGGTGERDEVVRQVL